MDHGWTDALERVHDLGRIGIKGLMDPGIV